MVRPVNSFSDESLIGKLKPYPAMKNSNVPYVGEIPTHWDVRKLKHWLLVNQATLPEDTDPDYTFDYLDIGSVGTGRLVAPPERIRFGDSPSRARRVVRQGDTIVSTVRTYLKAVWHAEEPKRDQIASTGFAVLTPRSSTCPKFISYLCQSQPFTDRVTANSVGVAYPAIAETKLESFKVAIPPLSDQVQIAGFLDQAIGKIERYIRVKGKLIALMDEQRQAVIEQAVTGRIVGGECHTPKWSDVALKSVVSAIQTGPFGSQLHASEYVDGGTPVINPSHMAGGRIRSDPRVAVSPAKAEELAVHRLQVGDIVMARRGDLGRCALVGVGEEGWICGTGSLRIRPNESAILPSFLALYLRSRRVREALTVASIGATMDNLNAMVVSQLPVPLPPLAEQASACRLLLDATARLDAVSDRVQKQILAVNVYRHRLTTDVVTGKVDVREAAALSDGGASVDEDEMG